MVSQSKAWLAALRPQLLTWFVLRSGSVSAVAAVVALVYLLLWPEPLGLRTPWPWVFICMHALVVAWLSQRVVCDWAGYVYTRGFSRDVLWAHLVMAELLSILIVWLPSALVLWTGLRSTVQDRVLLNPWFPMMMAGESVVPWGWLAGYGFMLAVFHYAAVRRLQPTRDRAAGTTLAVGAVAVGLTLMAEGFHAAWYGYLVWSSLGLTSLALFIGAWRLHRRLEVHR